MKKFRNPFADLTLFERGLWCTSVAVIVLSAVLMGGADLFSVIASLIGVTALIFVAKGYVIGQILTVVFAVFYGFISFGQQYYGEMITYLGMSSPMAIAAAIAWLKNPFRGTKEVAVRPMTRMTVVWLFVSTVLVTAAFYFILGAMGTASLAVSTISVTTSFLASALTYLRSPYYALAYAANDVVLIVLWIIAAIGDISYLSMVLCFVMFLCNDLYGFFNWRRMEKTQKMSGAEYKSPLTNRDSYDKI
ncbi:MAG: nicotinamide mononucleotide transporter [Clostridia bacterium]|nr:nicotinamide mononucleotide transporter [Clostridia bacterium]